MGTKHNNTEINTKYNDFIIISEPYIKNNKKVIDCKCKCNKIKTFNVSSLKSKTCCNFCRSSSKRKYKPGDKIGHLTVIGYKTEKTKNRYRIIVKCDCGRVYDTKTPHLCKIKTCKKCTNKYTDLIGSKHHAYSGLEFITQTHFGRIKISAKRKNREFNLTLQYLNNLLIQQNHKCFLSNVDIKIGNSKEETTASLDRIDSSKGYIEGNVQWVHKLINIMKQDMSDIEFVDWCRKIVYFKDKK